MNSHSEPVSAPRTKRCPYCGAEYPNTFTDCVIDHSPLVMTAPDPGPTHVTSERAWRFAFWPSDEHSLGGVWMRSLIWICVLCYSAKLWTMTRRIEFPRSGEYLGIGAMFILFFSSLFCIGSNNRRTIAGLAVIMLGLVWFVPVLPWALVSLLR